MKQGQNNSLKMAFSFLYFSAFFGVLAEINRADNFLYLFFMTTV